MANRMVRNGEPLRISARDHNDWQLAAIANKSSHTGSLQPTGTPVDFRARIYNDSGEDVPRYGILAVTGLKIEPDDNDAILDDPLFTGDATASVGDSFAVSLEPIADGDIGRCVLGGKVACKINVGSASHEWAVPSTDDADVAVTRLTSAASGTARILWKDSGTGEKDAVILFPTSSGGTSHRLSFDKFFDLDSVSGTYQQYKPGGSAGAFLLPSVHQVLPEVPGDSDDSWRTWIVDFNMSSGDSTYGSGMLAVDASSTGDTLSVYYVDSSREMISDDPIGTLTKYTPGSIATPTHYWKGGVRGSIDEEDAGVGITTPKIENTGWISEAVSAVNQATPSFSVAANLASSLSADDTIHIVGSTGNDGDYTVISAVWGGAATVVTVSESISDSTIDGNLTKSGSLLVESAQLTVAGYIRQDADQNNGQWEGHYRGDNIAECFLSFDGSVYYFYSHADRPGYRTGEDDKYIRLTDDGLPVLWSMYMPSVWPPKHSMIFEEVPESYIPRGCVMIQPVGDGSGSIKIRFRHHYSGDMYAMTITTGTPHSGSTYDPTYPLVFQSSEYSDGGSWYVQFLWTTTDDPGGSGQYGQQYELVYLS